MNITRYANVNLSEVSPDINKSMAWSGQVSCIAPWGPYALLCVLVSWPCRNMKEGWGTQIIPIDWHSMEAGLQVRVPGEVTCISHIWGNNKYEPI